MTTHAACSPSSATMWLNCAASITKAAGMTRPSSKYAREGTAAHSVAEMILKGDVFLPDKIKVENEEFIVSPGMCRALNPYVHHVQYLASQPGAIAVFEHRIVVPGTLNMVWGTLDSGIQTVFGDLHVVDLKFGKGHIVKPDAPQLKLYALGLANHFVTEDLDTGATLTVCQPRVGNLPLQSFYTTLGDLYDWLYAEVMPAIAHIAEGDETENAGSHCRWCVRQTECAAFASMHQSRAADAFDDIDMQELTEL